jgi:hypothetical protein
MILVHVIVLGWWNEADNFLKAEKNHVNPANGKNPANGQSR